jgi:hypothetical protein
MSSGFPDMASPSIPPAGQAAHSIAEREPWDGPRPYADVKTCGRRRMPRSPSPAIQVKRHIEGGALTPHPRCVHARVAERMKLSRPASQPRRGSLWSRS